MSLIRASCRDCGDVELRSRGMKAIRRVMADGAEEYLYRFRCPICRMTEVRPCEEYIVSVLLAGGVKLQEISIGDLQPTGFDPAALAFTGEDADVLKAFLYGDPVALHEAVEALIDSQS